MVLCLLDWYHCTHLVEMRLDGVASLVSELAEIDSSHVHHCREAVPQEIEVQSLSSWLCRDALEVMNGVMRYSMQLLVARATSFCIHRVCWGACVNGVYMICPP